MLVGVCHWAVHGATESWVFTVVAFCAALNGCGVVSYGRDQHLGTGWFVTVSQTPAEVGLLGSGMGLSRCLGSGECILLLLIYYPYPYYYYRIIINLIIN